MSEFWEPPCQKSRSTQGICVGRGVTVATEAPAQGANNVVGDIEDSGGPLLHIPKLGVLSR